jgi:phage terminase small subunit
LGGNELKSNQLTPRQAQFCNEFLLDGNATRAAVRAGYAESSARNHASRLMTNDCIREVIEDLTTAQSERIRFDADTVLRELANLSTTTMAAFVDDEGIWSGS